MYSSILILCSSKIIWTGTHFQKFSRFLKISFAIFFSRFFELINFRSTLNNPSFNNTWFSILITWKILHFQTYLLPKHNVFKMIRGGTFKLQRTTLSWRPRKTTFARKLWPCQRAGWRKCPSEYRRSCFSPIFTSDSRFCDSDTVS